MENANTMHACIITCLLPLLIAVICSETDHHVVLGAPFRLLNSGSLAPTNAEGNCSFLVWEDGKSSQSLADQWSVDDEGINSYSNNYKTKN